MPPPGIRQGQGFPEAGIQWCSVFEVSLPPEPALSGSPVPPCHAPTESIILPTIRTCQAPHPEKPVKPVTSCPSHLPGHLHLVPACPHTSLTSLAPAVGCLEPPAAPPCSLQSVVFGSSELPRLGQGCPRRGIAGTFLEPLSLVHRGRAGGVPVGRVRGSQPGRALGVQPEQTGPWPWRRAFRRVP